MRSLPSVEALSTTTSSSRSAGQSSAQGVEAGAEQVGPVPVEDHQADEGRGGRGSHQAGMIRLRPPARGRAPAVALTLVPTPDASAARVADAVVARLAPRTVLAAGDDAGAGGRAGIPEGSRSPRSTWSPCPRRWRAATTWSPASTPPAPSTRPCRRPSPTWRRRATRCCSRPPRPRPGGRRRRPAARGLVAAVRRPRPGAGLPPRRRLRVAVGGAVPAGDGRDRRRRGRPTTGPGPSCGRDAGGPLAAGAGGGPPRAGGPLDRHRGRGAAQGGPAAAGPGGRARRPSWPPPSAGSPRWRA